MREWRKTHRLSAEEKQKRNARAHLKLYIKRGNVKKQESCYVCGEPSQEAHHADHRQEFDVVWLCRQHHLMVTWGKLDLLPKEQV